MSFLSEISSGRALLVELSENTRCIIIKQALGGKSHQKIAAEIGCSKSTVSDTVKRWRNHHTTTTLPRSGRLKAISIYETRALYRAA